jgi:hypothetical protein
MKVSILSLVLLCLLAEACPARTPASFNQRDFALTVTLITSEHSRDSNSVTRSVKIAGSILLYEETHQGARANRHPPLKKEFNLTNDDRNRLIELLKGNALLTTKTISKSSDQRGITRDFELSIKTKLAGRETLISITAPRSATELKNEPLYQGSMLLIGELYQIINRTDREITFDELIQ